MPVPPRRECAPVPVLELAVDGGFVIAVFADAVGHLLVEAVEQCEDLFHGLGELSVRGYSQVAD